jgi:beta-ribofuranosylaminobenzene 5'-phosphate synthase
MSSQTSSHLTNAIEIAAPSRLHFGMFGFGRDDGREFGVVGAMVSRPGVRLRVTPAERFETDGPLKDRVGRVAQRVARAWGLAAPPACLIEVVDGAPEHVGLGTGTQLALAVAAGLQAFRGGDTLAAGELARLAGRAERSAIGTYGFVHGGLLVEGGKLPGEAVSPLEGRVALPAAWRFVLIWPHGEYGLSGDAERSAFRELPPAAEATTARLRNEVATVLLPAARTGDFASFSESLYRFGHEAGLCFAARQGGPFATPAIEALVQTIRRLGIRGVGQSSWGPAVFAVLELDEAAHHFALQIQEHVGPNTTVLVTEPNHSGARITRRER